MISSIWQMTCQTPISFQQLGLVHDRKKASLLLGAACGAVRSYAVSMSVTSVWTPPYLRFLVG